MRQLIKTMDMSDMTNMHYPQSASAGSCMLPKSFQGIFWCRGPAGMRYACKANILQMKNLYYPSCKTHVYHIPIYFALDKLQLPFHNS